MAWKSSGGFGGELAGFAAQYAFTRLRMATTEMHFYVRLNGLVHNFSALNAKMPEMKGLSDIPLKPGEKPLQEVLDEISILRIKARKEYQSIFEEESSYSEEENKFALLLDEILLKEDELAARIKLIDAQRAEIDKLPE